MLSKPFIDGLEDLISLTVVIRHGLDWLRQSLREKPLIFHDFHGKLEIHIHWVPGRHACLTSVM
jgi:hypothetical protein